MLPLNLDGVPELFTGRIKLTELVRDRRNFQFPADVNVFLSKAQNFNQTSSPIEFPTFLRCHRSVKREGEREREAIWGNRGVTRTRISTSIGGSSAISTSLLITSGPLSAPDENIKSFLCCHQGLLPTCIFESKKEPSIKVAFSLHHKSGICKHCCLLYLHLLRLYRKWRREKRERSEVTTGFT